MFGYMSEFKEHYLQLLYLANYEMKVEKYPISFQYDFQSKGLKTLREQYDLVNVAGTGDEISQFFSLMRWVSDRFQHGNVPAPKPCNALNLLGIKNDAKVTMNCYSIACVLNEVFLSLGYFSRRVHCRPYDAHDSDSHVVTVVFSKTLNKWVYMDPSWNTFVTDDIGTLLNLEEFRYRLAKKLPVLVNGEYRETEWSKFYIGYMAKNLFWFMSPLLNGYDEDSRKEKRPCLLLPAHYEPIELKYNLIPKDISLEISRNPQNFWSSPCI